MGGQPHLEGSTVKKQSFADKLKAVAQTTDEDKGINRLYRNELEKVMPRVNGGTYKNPKAGIDATVDIKTASKTDGLFRCWCINNESGQQITFISLLECKRVVDFNNPEDRAPVVL